jgi:hypothetical protein
MDMEFLISDKVLTIGTANFAVSLLPSSSLQAVNINRHTAINQKDFIVFIGKELG